MPLLFPVLAVPLIRVRFQLCCLPAACLSSGPSTHSGEIHTHGSNRSVTKFKRKP